MMLTPITTQQPPRQRYLALQAMDELDVAMHCRVNLLLVGSDDAIEYLLDALRPSLRRPCIRWSPGEELVLPRPYAGAIILRQVGRMSRGQQGALFDWLEAVNGEVQVVSTADVPLWPEVVNGRFMPGLFYRLNTVMIQPA